MILCFPLNPLVLLNIIEPHGNDVLTVLVTIIWIVGMIFVISLFHQTVLKQRPLQTQK